MHAPNKDEEVGRYESNDRLDFLSVAKIGGSGASELLPETEILSETKLLPIEKRTLL